jgi:hypothetical protein
MSIEDNFREEALFHHQLKMEYEHRMWCDWLEQKEQEDLYYEIQAQQHFNHLEQMEAEQSAMNEDYSFAL